MSPLLIGSRGRIGRVERVGRPRAHRARRAFERAVQPQPAGRVRPTAAELGAQQAFINAVAPGALAAQRQYGIPAAVTIAQAIDESGWGQSQLATQDNNLFGIKGSRAGWIGAAADGGVR